MRWTRAAAWVAVAALWLACGPVVLLAAGVAKEWFEGLNMSYCLIDSNKYSEVVFFGLLMDLNRY